MALEIVVCVKHTPSSTSVPVDPATGQVKADSLPHELNPFDAYAVEEALRIKEKVAGSKVTALTFGKQTTEGALRDALALGCDEAVLVSDPSFEGSDHNAAAYLLAQAVKKLSGTKLVMFGKQTNDGESGLMAGQVGAWLDWPSAAGVKKVAAVDDSAITVERLMEDGTDTVKLKLPAALAVTKEINEPRLPSLKGKMSAKKAVIPKWGPAELSADAAKVGANSPTATAKVAPVPSRPSGVVIAGGSPEEKAHNLVEKLKEAKLI
ncbi:MAG TPA: electron transfer flavoprotein subunit beta/FixA family protein [Elusimicrobiota bacterium]|jgi:electron transfer flavoprotein beta subunit|nr:electron transfer flavoprotein subunit beta/FixA family protein [Elusimicrobiota bacterium]